MTDDAEMRPAGAPPTKATIHFERRSDGGARIWSDDIAGLVLSHSNAEKVLEDLGPVLKVFLLGMAP